MEGKHSFRAVEIPVPFGQISGKWYGPSNIRPLLFIHGFTDNSGTFDRLIPLLPAHASYLAIDLPGHGLSSDLPNGMMYHLADTSLHILRIMQTYNWTRVSLVAHSLGAIMSYIFIGLFPELVDLFVAIDALQPSFPGGILNQQAYYIKRALEMQDQNGRNELCKGFTYEEIMEKVHHGLTSRIPRELCHHLLARNIVASKTIPDKYFFRQDSRTKYPNILGWSKDTNAETARNVCCPVLVIKSTEAIFFSELDEFSQLIEIMKKFNSNVKIVTVPGCHYVHLIEPERVAKVISEFLESCEYFRNKLESKL
ncbi:probable serine hydrolase [Wyeomyia smithii]|uniref:probable serine hydrolase n=1 Tax=Wyeomyia smithii TaxID=174621 RepID=UPI002467D693|nr:probable serine hydrolase [Wyeomyia smithii]XP_055549497.1 probable serine hydrolase [Wyeomyia smithii]